MALVAHLSEEASPRAEAPGEACAVVISGYAEEAACEAADASFREEPWPVDRCSGAWLPDA